MNRYTKYRQNAADCFAVAQQLSDPGLKASMLEMAQCWLTLAEEQGDPPPAASGLLH